MGVQQDIADTAAMLRGRAEVLRGCADRLDAEAAGLSGGGPADDGVTVVRGRAIIEALLDLTRIGEEYHYTELLSLLRQGGYHCNGKDPAATLLASMNRAPEFERVRPRSGQFRRVS